jgi:transcriptional regulator with XRE-family HTH domain
LKSAQRLENDILVAMLRRARERAHLSQEQLALMLRKPQSFVSKYESGHRRLDVIEFLDVAEAIGFQPGAFLEEVRARTKSPSPDEKM